MLGARLVGRTGGDPPHHRGLAVIGVLLTDDTRTDDVATATTTARPRRPPHVFSTSTTLLTLQTTPETSPTAVAPTIPPRRRPRRRRAATAPVVVVWRVQVRPCPRATTGRSASGAIGQFGAARGEEVTFTATVSTPTPRRSRRGRCGDRLPAWRSVTAADPDHHAPRPCGTARYGPWTPPARHAAPPTFTVHATPTARRGITPAAVALRRPTAATRTQRQPDLNFTVTITSNAACRVKRVGHDRLLDIWPGRQRDEAFEEAFDRLFPRAATLATASWATRPRPRMSPPKPSPALCLHWAKVGEYVVYRRVGAARHGQPRASTRPAQAARLTTANDAGRGRRRRAAAGTCRRAAHLSRRQREVIALHYLSDLSEADVAMRSASRRAPSRHTPVEAWPHSANASAITRRFPLPSERDELSGPRLRPVPTGCGGGAGSRPSRRCSALAYRCTVRAGARVVQSASWRRPSRGDPDLDRTRGRIVGRCG